MSNNSTDKATRGLCSHLNLCTRTKCSRFFPLEGCFSITVYLTVFNSDFLSFDFPVTCEVIQCNNNCSENLSGFEGLLPLIQTKIN